MQQEINYRQGTTPWLNLSVLPGDQPVSLLFLCKPAWYGQWSRNNCWCDDCVSYLFNPKISRLNFLNIDWGLVLMIALLNEVSESRIKFSMTTSTSVLMPDVKLEHTLLLSAMILLHHLAMKPYPNHSLYWTISIYNEIILPMIFSISCFISNPAVLLHHSYNLCQGY